MIPRFGPKQTAITGIIISALGNFCFSFVEQIESKIIFTITSLFLRGTIAFGDSNYLTSEFTMIMFIFSGQVGVVIVREYALIKLHFILCDCINIILLRNTLEVFNQNYKY